MSATDLNLPSHEAKRRRMRDELAQKQAQRRYRRAFRGDDAADDANEPLAVYSEVPEYDEASASRHAGETHPYNYSQVFETRNYGDYTGDRPGMVHARSATVSVRSAHAAQAIDDDYDDVAEIADIEGFEAPSQHTGYSSHQARQASGHFMPKKADAKADAKQQPTIRVEPATVHDNYSLPDMFVCGGCHLITANIRYFIQHRSKPCPVKQVNRGDDEPERLQCAMCRERCRNGWDLVAHMGRKHCIYLFNETNLVTD